MSKHIKNWQKQEKSCEKKKKTRHGITGFLVKIILFNKFILYVGELKKKVIRIFYSKGYQGP